MGGAVLAVAGFVSSQIAASKAKKARKKQEKEEKKARRVEQAIASRENQRRRRQAVREARIKRADIISAGGNQGVLGSSGVRGGAGSVVSQGAEGVTNIDQLESMFERRNIFLEHAADFASDAQRAEELGATRAALIGAAGSIAQSSGVFSNNPSTTTTVKQNVAQSGVFVPRNPKSVFGGGPIHKTGIGR